MSVDHLADLHLPPQQPKAPQNLQQLKMSPPKHQRNLRQLIRLQPPLNQQLRSHLHQRNRRHVIQTPTGDKTRTSRHINNVPHWCLASHPNEVNKLTTRRRCRLKMLLGKCSSIFHGPLSIAKFPLAKFCLADKIIRSSFNGTLTHRTFSASESSTVSSAIRVLNRVHRLSRLNANSR